MTNKEHGGSGWSLGEYLWSPVGRFWDNSMSKPEEGDTIIHAITHKGSKYFYGHSIVAKKVFSTENRPPSPGNWDKHKEYYKIELRNYKVFDNGPMKVQEFLNQNVNKLKSMIPQKSFYNEKGDIRTSQGKYLSPVSNQLTELILDYLKLNHTYFEDYKNSKNQYSDSDTIETMSANIPGEVKIEVTRKIRDTKMIKKIKSEFKNECQICGIKQQLLSKDFYSEGHHLRPLGGVHQGPDIKENVIILCPNHHVEFDYGLITIERGIIKHVDENNPFHLCKVKYSRNDISKYLDYHNKNIFNQGN